MATKKKATVATDAASRKAAAVATDAASPAAAVATDAASPAAAVATTAGVLFRPDLFDLPVLNRKGKKVAQLSKKRNKKQ